MKNIFVVSEEKLKDFAYQLVHLISKTENLTASYVTTKQYRENEMKYYDKDFVIFLGNDKLSQYFISFIEPQFSEDGIKWGFDYNKAVIYVDGNPGNDFDFIEDLNTGIMEIKESINKNIKEIEDIKLSKIVLFQLNAVKFELDGLMVINSYTQKSNIKKEQYKIGILTFLNLGLDEFVSSKKEITS